MEDDFNRFDVNWWNVNVYEYFKLNKLMTGTTMYYDSSDRYMEVF